MGYKKKRKKTPKEKEYTKLYNKALDLWKAISFERDGMQCQVQKHYPNINITHSSVFQIDHCFSRSDHNLFFNPHNGTVVCSSCNAAKGFKNKAIDFAIYEIVRKREGEIFGQMLDIHQTHTPNTNWKQIWWLEKVIEELDKLKGG